MEVIMRVFIPIPVEEVLHWASSLGNEEWPCEEAPLRKSSCNPTMLIPPLTLNCKRLKLAETSLVVPQRPPQMGTAARV